MSSASVLRRASRWLVRQGSCVLISILALPFRMGIGRKKDSIGGEVRTILVIRLDLMGDVVFTMPAVASLRARYPQSKIVMLTLPYTSGLAQMYECVDEVIAVDTNLIRTPRGLFSAGTWMSYLSTLRKVRSRRFDLCVSMSGRTASLCAFLSGSGRTVGYRAEAYPFTLSEPVNRGRYWRRTHEIEYGRVLACAAGAERIDVIPVPLVRTPARVFARRQFAAHAVGDNDLIIALHVGAGNGSAKRWPVGQWMEFARAAQRQFNAKIALVGGPGDQALANAIFTGADFPLVSFVGQTTLEQLAAVLTRADLLVSADSGPLHLATALKRPVVGIYGPTDTQVYGPYGDGPSVVLRHDLPCSPCYAATSSAECPLGDPICMRLVTVPRVLAAAGELLARR